MPWPPANLPIPQDWTDDTDAATVHADAHNTIGAALDDIVGHLDPSTLSRFFSYAPDLAGIASAGYAEDAGAMTWATNATIVGTDITVNGGSPGYLDINADGIYAIAYTLRVAAESGTFTSVDLSIGGIPTGSPERIVTNPGNEATESFSWTGFLPAGLDGGQLSSSVTAETDAGTWGVGEWNLWVQRIA